jgi:tetrapyrrole methylase family protein / MazG family protein
LTTHYALRTVLFIMTITIVGLGPGDGRLLTRAAWDILVNAPVLYLRTGRHPAVADLPPAVTCHTFDHLYETADTFATVYQTIIQELLQKAQQRDLIYAVPGHPYVGEATVTGLVEAARAAGIPVTIVDGLSFVEPTLAAAEVDALDGLQVFDAIEVAAYHYPPLNPDNPVLLGQVYSRLIAADLKLTLMALYPDDHPAQLIHAAGNEAQVVESLPLYAIDRSPQIDHLTSLYLPPLSRASDLSALAETVAVLRSPEGCPWDREQTPQSMRSGLLEEKIEVLTALDEADADALCEELGDLLLHVVMQAQMAAEADEFKLTDVVASIETKLKRRHPHVWGNWQVSSTGEVLRNWDQIKQAEKGAERPSSLLNNVPDLLPALAQSQKIQHKVGKIGFDWPDVNGVWDKLSEEIAELRAATTPEERTAELGDILFVLVNLARWLGVDAESSLRQTNLRFTRRFQLVEQLAAGHGLDLGQMNIDQLELLWDEAKSELAKTEGST